MTEIRNYLAAAVNFLPDGKKPGYLKFIGYLDQWFFNDDATFNPGYYQYFDAIVFTGNYKVSTNCLERVNKTVKDMAAGGNLPLSRACRVLIEVKQRYLSDKFERVNYCSRGNSRRYSRILYQNAI